MKQLLLLASLVASLGANAASFPCSIHPKKGSTDADLMKFAKISKADAETTALKAVNIASASIEDSELNAEGGCLIYSFDIKSPGEKSVAEVTVDAGTGKVLAVVPNSAMAQPDKMTPAESRSPNAR